MRVLWTATTRKPVTKPLPATSRHFPPSRLLERYPKRLYLLDLGIDLASPYGEMVATVVRAMAQLERRLVGERTRAALAIKRSEDVILGRPREVDVKIVEKIETLYRCGELLAGIARTLNADGLRSPRGSRWYPSGVQRVIRYAEAA
jgi:DNA invertase Pin-like site-specific DNA recombinase